MADVVPEYKRKFLVVIDDTPECDRAVTFAAHRVKRTGGIVLLMSVVEPPEFHGLGVEDVLRAEALEAAEENLDKRLRRISEIAPIKTETVIREGRAADQIEAVIADVLARNPGQLEQYRGGKEALFGFFVGQTMKAMQGKANPAVVNELLKKALAS